MRFPYTELGPDFFRPIVAVWIWGPIHRVLKDGLLDTGADRTLLPRDLARELGIDVDGLMTPVTIQSATGQNVPCKTTTVILELVRNSTRLRWQGDIAVSRHPLRWPHWGFKGFLEYFRAKFDGPRRFVTLTPGVNLPKRRSSRRTRPR